MHDGGAAEEMTTTGTGPCRDGCTGTRVAGRTACLAHLPEPQRTEYLGSLAPGADLDLRGTVLTPELLTALLTALRDPAARRPLIGTARFDGARFTGPADFGGARFTGDAWFPGVRFEDEMSLAGAEFGGDAWFHGARFARTAGFGGAQFRGNAWFHDTRFGGDGWFGSARFHGGGWFAGACFDGRARFGAAQFTGDARFNDARFRTDAYFTVARFSGAANFDNAEFTGTAGFGGARFLGAAFFGETRFAANARFDTARFGEALTLGPLVCAEALVLAGAVFGAPVVIEAAVRRAVCVRTRWTSTATLRLRHATVDLTDAVLEFPVTIAAAPPFRGQETPFTDREPAGVRLLSLDGADAAHLTLNSVDLSACRFAGALHLDQLRLEGRCTFGSTPRRWSPRRTLAEEHHWRAWSVPPEGSPAPPEPAALSVLYRQLRKSLEDGKNEPDAADFYYGEMEMRRHDTTRPRAERALLTAYWALSGYGLRASRALGWLSAAITVTVAALTLWGVPAGPPYGSGTGRFTAERVDTAFQVAVNSVVFRSAEEDLTTAGAYIELTARLTEPILLGLAILAVRGRLKR
ncbi:pentapeptide repeat-containing protein [Streptomyces aidingensis]|uniref:Pentapeptide repeat-containing protein n=1 Tax=Streptomyces aidingensis TaxID=910347 RepID=A0A1I1FHU6_9ACTN|nr:pentapeptide repeat-containing protein [Streptomyces aidingensis]SFB98935.1 Pentapeptide repeat-containing protein [Streptomyces aidingensis]